MQDTGLSSEARIHLPIEGHTRWPLFMRILAFGSVLSALLMGIIYILLLMPSDSATSPVGVVAGLLFLLLVEFVAVRFVIIPWAGDYGRFRIVADKVEYFPLTLSGAFVRPGPQSVPAAEFAGVSVRIGDGSSRDANYEVFLDHRQRRRRVRIRHFASFSQAESFARALSDTMGLKLSMPE